MPWEAALIIYCVLVHCWLKLSRLVLHIIRTVLSLTMTIRILASLALDVRNLETLRPIENSRQPRSLFDAVHPFSCFHPRHPYTSKHNVDSLPRSLQTLTSSDSQTMH